LEDQRIIFMIKYANLHLFTYAVLLKFIIAYDTLAFQYVSLSFS